jgi:hypothetical protein
MAQVPPALDPAPGLGPSCRMVRTACALLALFFLAAVPARADTGATDEAAFRQRNDDFVRAFLTSDVARFRTLLADDFIGVLANGTLIDRAEFLREAQVKPDAMELRLHDVVIHIYADSAIVSAFVTYHRSKGDPVRTRYTTCYARRDGVWSVTMVQWTWYTGL